MGRKLSRWFGSIRRFSERGQTSVFVLLVLGIFLIGAVGFAVDFANCWFHRQTAQGAADAACSADQRSLPTSLPGPASTATPHRRTVRRPPRYPAGTPPPTVTTLL